MSLNAKVPFPVFNSIETLWSQWTTNTPKDNHFLETWIIITENADERDMSIICTNSRPPAHPVSDS